VGRIANDLVSIILPCHNAGRFLTEALDSALRQTHRELEIVAIDDGSRDGTGAILQQAAQRDERVRVLANQSQLGIIKTLNRAVAASNGQFIARMDADDVLDPERIATQLRTLKDRPDVAVVGSSTIVIDEEGRAIGRRRVRCTHPVALRFLALFAIPVMHPTIMARYAAMQAFPYRDAPECLHAEDYDLFTRMLAGGVQLVNVDTPLYRLRTHAAGVSRRFEPIQISNFVSLARAHLDRTLGIRLTAGVQRVLVNRMDTATTVAELQTGLKWLDRLRDQFLRDAVGNDEAAHAEVLAVANQQRIDILGQALLKGPARRRLASAALVVRRGPSFASASSRGYLRDKLASRAVARS
jgi:glycosyltransferase involved in cell wall biosynthesis